MSNNSTIDKIDQGLLLKVDPDGKLNVTACLQCGRCSAGCTMRAETDILPHQLNRMVALGLNDEVLASKAIWVCASCHTCVSRCPMKVDTPALVDKLREMAHDTTANKETERVRVFNDTMLANMRRFGRVYEFAMMGEYKLRTRDFFSDLDKFPKMLVRGKMKLFPPMARGRKAVSSIFANAKARQARRTK